MEYEAETNETDYAERELTATDASSICRQLRELTIAKGRTQRRRLTGYLCRLAA
jgi:hypothetical protein